MTICIIPARGGSKRIPRKNIREFYGKPMIEWSVQAALDSMSFERIVVSTDDEEIAEVAVRAGAEAPFRRNVDLADDYTPTIPVVVDALNQLGVASETPVCCLYATAPFVASTDLIAGLNLLKQNNSFFVVSMTTYAFPIQRALYRKADGRYQMFNPSMMQTRSQDLEEAWHDAGQFYWARADTWRVSEGILDQDTYSIAIPRYRVQDIDTEEDWRRAEIMMKALKLDETQ